MDCKKREKTETKTSDGSLNLLFTLGKEEKMFEIKPEISVKELKIQAKEAFKDCFDNISLIIDTEIMEDSKTLADYSPKDCANIQIIKEQVIVEKQGIYVDYYNERTFIEASLEETIEDIKYKIEKELKIPFDKQELNSESIATPFENIYKLKEYKIRNRDTIVLTQDRKGYIRIRVKDIQDTSYFIEIRPEDKISTLKQKIYEATAAPADSLRFVFMGKKLNDSKTVEQSKMKHGCEVYLTSNLVGGKQ